MPTDIVIFIGTVLSTSGALVAASADNEFLYVNPEPLVVEVRESAPPLSPDAPRPIQHFARSGAVPSVPFYSQFTDVSDPDWRGQACGVVSLAMLIEYYYPGSITVDSLLNQGIASGAYLNGAGWMHKGLADLGAVYGLSGTNFDYSASSMDAAFSEFASALERGPVIASVYYTFTPGHPIPHLVLINGIDGDRVFYNDPAEESGGGSISVKHFKSAWKKRYIALSPQTA